MRRPVLCYVIRLWAEFDGTSWIWRVSLQALDQSSATAQGFSSLSTAVAYLIDQMEMTIAEQADE